MKVLVAEDDGVVRHLLQSMLTKWGYEVLTAHDGGEAWSVLADNDGPRLALLDWMMPHFDGPEICRKVRQRTDRPYTYIILLSTRDRKEDVAKGLEAGADDYVIKPFDSLELRARVNAGRRVLDLQAALLDAKQSLEIQATHDPLTSIWNRGAILNSCQKEFERSYRNRVGVGLIMADLDHFKQVNDTHGHQIGDTVLCEAVKRMQQAIRTYDSIGRYGGEEFLMLVPGCDETGLTGLAERVRQCVSQSSISTKAGALPITVSLGIAVRPPDDKSSLDDMIKMADDALYLAKRGGRNRVVVGYKRDR